MTKELTGAKDMRKELQALLENSKKKSAESKSPTATKVDQITVLFRCATTGNPFVVIYGRKRKNTLYRIKHVHGFRNGSSDERGAAGGYTITEDIDPNMLSDKGWYCPWCVSGNSKTGSYNRNSKN